MNKYIINEEETQIYPLTSYQKDVWVEQCLYKGQPIYNIGGYADIKGCFDYLIIQKATQKLIEDNDSLRIRIFENNGQPYQKILKELKYEVPFYDFSEKVNSEKFSLEWMQNELLKPFDFDSDENLFEFAFIKVNDNRYLYFSKAHHILTDGWGYSVLFQTLVRNYNNIMDSKNELEKYSYCEFIQENEKYKNSDRYLKDKQFWQNKFNDIPEALFTKGISSNEVTVSNRESMVIKRRVYDDIIEFCKDKNCSAFHFFLGILAIYFGKTCNKENVVIGVPILNRTKANYKKIIGHFANVIPVKISISKEKTFEDVMNEIKMELSTSYRHQKLSLGEIYNSIYEEKKESLFDITLSYEKHDYSTNFINTETDIKTLDNQSERNSLAVFIREFDDSKDVEINFDYSLEVFKKFIPVTNIIKHVESLIKESLNNCQKNIGDIEILSKEEKHKILYEFNDTEADYERNKTLYEVFEEQVEKTPNNVALIFENKTLTYKELNEKANQLALTLRANGVKDDSIVGIMVYRSFEMIIGVLGILKAGGAYLPIDPEYPEDRIKYMIEDSQINILLVQGKILKNRNLYKNAYINIIDLENKELYQGESENLEATSKSNNLAYIIYTSGSTGKPKGVMIEHYSAINRINWMQKKYPIEECDTILQKTTYTFDVSVWELFWWSFKGAKLNLLSPGDEKEPLKIVEAVENNKVTTMHFVPSMLNAFLEYVEKDENLLEKLRSLRQVFASGEALTVQQVERFNRTLGKKNETGLYNLYGPTEATVDVSYYDCPLDENIVRVPIGKPIDNIKLYILDKYQKIQPIGISGELYISGDGVARGYLNKLELTSEKFVKDTFFKGKRMYKTGDLARWLLDGNIEYIGRIDNQVKIRGFRIELGEVESKILSVPNVKAAVVTVNEDTSNNKYLCAYIVSDKKINVFEFKNHLSKDLPTYMIPSYFVQLEKMPLTSNGKVNKKALPEPKVNMETGTVYVAPRNEVEEILAKVWKDVLKVSQVGINHNFFELGGDSIKAIQVLSRLNRYKLKLETKDLMKHPTIGELSNYVKATNQKIEQGVVEGKAQLTPIQNWLFEENYEYKNYFNQGIMLYRREGFEESIIREIFSKLVEHHDALRMLVKTEGDNIVQYNRGIDKDLYELEVIDLNNVENVEKEIEKEANRIQENIDLKTGPLFKSAIFKTMDGDHLLMVIHHLVVDGVSWRIILEDLATGYEQALKKEEIKFKEKTNSFKEWSDKLYDYSDNDKLLKEMEYWKSLEDSKVKPIPKDKSIEVRKYKYKDNIKVELSNDETESLLKQVNKAYNTEINDILLTALGLAIKHWTGDSRILVNIEGHGREDIIKNMDISRTVGWFTTLYPVLLNMEGEKDFSHYIKAVKENIRHIPEKGIGYGILKYITKAENKENLKFNLKPEISFNYLGQFDQDLDTGIFSMSNMPIGECTGENVNMPYCIDINSMVVEGRLQLVITYNQLEYDKATIEKVAESFAERLKVILEHCKAKDYTEATPSDFTFKNLTINEFDAVFKDLDKRNIKDMYMLSPMQQGMLYHSLLDSDSEMYFEQSALSMEGKVDITYIEESFNRLIQRHDVLRTIFVYEGTEKALQVVLKEKRMSVHVEDISHLDIEEKRNFIEEFKIKDRKAGFDLKNDLPMRVSIIKTSEEAYELIWSFHHIVMDGWCIGIIIKEFLNIYEALKLDKEIELEKVYPYSSYITWIEEQDQIGAGVYWEEYLKDYTEKASLPKMSNNKVNGKYNLAEESFKLDKDTMLKIKKLAKENNTTLSTIMQSIWGIILQKYNNTDDAVFGVVVSGRPHEITGIENMVGMFINTLPVRVTCAADKSFIELLSEMQQEAIESSKYSYSSLAEIQAKTDLKDNLIDNIMIFENYPMEEVLSNWSNNGKHEFNIKEAKLFEQTNYNFNIIVIPEEQLNIKFTYNSFVYAPNFVEQITEHLKNAISSVANKPDILVKEIELLTEKEKEQILYEFNNTKADYAKEKTIQELFEEQVQRTPNNIAVVFENKKLSYKELNEKANQLARTLRAKGVNRDSIVGIMIERSLEMIVGIMAILKSGGAYLPIDPSYPKERIEYIFKDSKCDILLTEESLLNDIKFLGECIDLSDKEVFDGEVSNLEKINTSNDLIYVIYTSGTTGNPKGTIVKHHSFTNLIQWYQNEFQISEEDNVLLMASVSFDLAQKNIYVPLITGGKLTLANKGLINYEKVNKIISENKITIINCAPSAFNPIVQLNKDTNYISLISLKYVFLGGEPINLNLLNIWMNSDNYHSEIVNTYGPTECTDIATFYRIKSQDNSVVPIGKPINNAKVYILNKDKKMLPIGISGELYISGDGVSRGYLDKSELTAEKFIDNPFEIGTKMYKTGDLARWLPDGNVEFIGRIDNQIKIRGFRIELGEIESRLLQHEEIKEVAVVVKENKENEKCICAYVVSEKNAHELNLKNYLKEILPEYMIPSYFVQVEKMPLTSNGKVNVKALSEPDFNINIGTEYIEPRDEIEEKLATLWTEILHIKMIGVKDNFFELGGHSLKVTSLVSKIHKEFNVEMPLKEIFKTPTIAQMAQYIKGAERNIYSYIQPVGEMEYYPMSSAQKRLYILNKLDGSGTSYNMPGVMLVEGSVDAISFEEVFRKLVKRHEALRTSFEVINGYVVQKIHEEVDFNVTYMEATEEKIKKLITEFVTPFDLDKAPLLRVGLVKMEKEKYLILFDMHHIIADGVSMDIFIREFTELYEGRSLPELRIQYKDFSKWQNDLFSTDAIKKQENYWLKAFSGEIPTLDMPLDYSRPLVQSFEGDNINFKLDKEITKKLSNVVKETGSTFYMVLLAAYNVLLYKYTGQEDIVVGSPIAGRPHGDLQNIIGMFVNTLAMRNYPKGNKTFEELLQEVKENSLNAYENQDYQFEELVEKLKLQRDMSRNPLFDTMFTLQNMDFEEIKIKDLRFTPYEFESKVSKFDLSIDAMESKEGIFFNLEYCTRIFKKETVERLAKHFINILCKVAENPSIRIEDIDMLAENEKTQLVYEFNDNTVEFKKDLTVHHMLERYAEETPDSAAVIFEGEEYSYKYINERANHIARYLRKIGLQREEPVVVLIDRSPLLVEGIIGIWKAGGAYIPVDPDYPSQRILTILAESKATFALTLSKYISPEIEKTYKGTLICLDKCKKEIEEESSKNLELHVDTTGLAYVIYTSGSTGKPKGAMIEHLGMMNHIYEEIKEFEITEKSIVAQNASHCFDVSIWQLFAAITAGGKIVIYPNEVVIDVRKFTDCIIENEVTVLEVVPSFLGVMLEYMEEKGIKLEKLKYLLVTGETVKSGLMRKWFEINPGIKAVNAYGPAEASDDIAQYIMEAAPDTENIPIGKPIQNINIYVVDKDMNICPIGVKGEICVSGIGVGKGYFNDPKRTKEVFVEDPFIQEKGIRLYKTGDMGRWLSDGNIEFYGRRDYQVKIRGHRIELEEIESRLLKHSEVKDAAVIDRNAENGDKYLCAYVVLKKNVEIGVVKDYLKEYLPSYMIPSYIVDIDKLPLSSNGKIDRKALPEPEGNINTGVEYIEPTDEVEEKLATLWREILGVERVGIKDNFFDLGGHSLKAANLVSRMHKEFNVELPLGEVFKHQTLKELASYIKTAETSIYESIKPVEDKEYYTVSSAQRRIYVLSEFENVGTSYNMPVAIIIEGSLDIKRIEDTFEVLIKRHESLRTSFDMIEGEIVQRVRNDYSFKVEYIENRTDNIDKIMESFVRPFDLSKAPLLRVLITKQEENRHILLIDIHHIISDGVSENILVEEFNKLYKGEELEKLTLQYRDYAEWQNNILKNKKIKEQEEYWLKVFKEVPVLDMPTDYLRPTVQNFEGASISFEVDCKITEGIRKIAAKEGATMFMVLLAAYNTMLSKYTGQEDIVVGTPIAERQHADLRNIMGIFVNTLALRNYPKEEKTFKEFLREVKENALKAYENQDYQFEELVEKLHIKRDISRNPIFDTMLVMENTEMKLFEADNLKFMLYESQINTSKFDLTLNALEKKDKICFGFQYSTKLFKRETVERIMQHYVNILEQVIQNIEIKLKDIDILAEEEKNNLLYEFNKTNAEYPRDKTVQEIFEEQAEKTPNNIAVLFEDSDLTYAELNKKSNQLALQLREKGVKSNVIVGIMVERSLEMMVGIMAILKAGGAYLPISPQYPISRIEYIIENSGMKLLLTQSSFVEKTEVLKENVDIINLSNKDIFTGNDTNLEPINTSKDLAYIIYTSGSTGNPKGVMIEHHSVINRLNWMQNKYPITENDVILQKTPFTFDVSVWELFWWSFVGAKVCMLCPDGEKDPKVIIDTVNKYNVTIIHFVPSMLNIFLSYIESSIDKKYIKDLNSLKQVFSSGEALNVEQVNRFNAAVNRSLGAKLSNLYGPTEVTVDVTYFDCSEGQELKLIPIGKPIDNIKLYILNENKKLQPIGVQGELYISGVGVARGYLNREELTKEKFVDNAFEPGTKMYRTGDLARWLCDGNIEYLGRIDHQVKIRGFRIELGEVEAAVRACAEVKQAVVIAYSNKNQDTKKLVAYIVPQGGEALSTSILRNALRKKLPDYMIPSIFMIMEEIPLTSNGKVNTKELPEPNSARLNPNEEYIEPQTQTEKMLAEIWAKVMEVDKVGIYDNFFDVGGDSILSIRVVSEAKKLGFNISIKQIFEYLTIHELANYIDNQEQEEQGLSDSEVAATTQNTAKAFDLLSTEDMAKIFNKMNK